jgi:hypothetical protein
VGAALRAFAHPTLLRSRLSSGHHQWRLLKARWLMIISAQAAFLYDQTFTALSFLLEIICAALTDEIASLPCHKQAVTFP